MAPSSCEICGYCNHVEGMSPLTSVLVHFSTFQQQLPKLTRRTPGSLIAFRMMYACARVHFVWSICVRDPCSNVTTNWWSKTYNQHCEHSEFVHCRFSDRRQGSEASWNPGEPRPRRLVQPPLVEQHSSRFRGSIAPQTTQWNTQCNCSRRRQKFVMKMSDFAKVG